MHRSYPEIGIYSKYFDPEVENTKFSSFNQEGRES